MSFPRGGWLLLTIGAPNLQQLGLNFQPPQYALQILQVPPGPDIGAALAAALFHRLGSRNAATIAREPWGWWDRELMPIAAVDTLFRDLTNIFFNFPSWMNLRSLEKSSSKTFDVFWDVLGTYISVRPSFFEFAIHPKSATLPVAAGRRGHSRCCVGLRLLRKDDLLTSTNPLLFLVSFIEVYAMANSK